MPAPSTAAQKLVEGHETDVRPWEPGLGSITLGALQEWPFSVRSDPPPTMTHDDCPSQDTARGTNTGSIICGADQPAARAAACLGAWFATDVEEERLRAIEAWVIDRASRQAITAAVMALTNRV